MLAVDLMHCLLEGLSHYYFHYVLQLTLLSVYAKDAPAFSYPFKLLGPNDVHGMHKNELKQVDNIHMSSMSVDSKDVDFRAVLALKLLKKNKKPLLFIAESLGVIPACANRSVTKVQLAEALVTWVCLCFLDTSLMLICFLEETNFFFLPPMQHHDLLPLTLWGESSKWLGRWLLHPGYPLFLGTLGTMLLVAWKWTNGEPWQQFIFPLLSSVYGVKRLPMPHQPLQNPFGKPSNKLWLLYLLFLWHIHIQWHLIKWLHIMKKSWHGLQICKSFTPQLNIALMNTWQFTFLTSSSSLVPFTLGGAFLLSTWLGSCSVYLTTNLVSLSLLFPFWYLIIK